MPHSQVHFDDEKADAFLAESSTLFEAILDAEDSADGGKIEQVLMSMEAAEKSNIVQALLGQLFHKSGGQNGAS